MSYPGFEPGIFGAATGFPSHYTAWSAQRLGVNPKTDPESFSLAILIFRQVARPSLFQVTARGIIDRELGGPCAYDRFYMHKVSLRLYEGSLVNGEPRTRTLWSQVWRSTDQATTVIPCLEVVEPTLKKLENFPEYSR